MIIKYSEGQVDGIYSNEEEASKKIKKKINVKKNKENKENEEKVQN